MSSCHESSPRGVAGNQTLPCSGIVVVRCCWLSLLSAVVNTLPISAQAVWVVDPTPILSLGEPQPGFPGDFYRITGALRFDDGSIMVADQGPRLMLFSPQGIYVDSFARRGQGPGEFQRIGWVQPLPGDSVLVWDPALYRASTFTSHGTFVEATTVRGAPPPNVVGRFADGTFLSWVYRDWPAKSRGLFQYKYELIRLSSTGDVLNTIATVPGGEAYEGETRFERVPSTGRVLKLTYVVAGYREAYVASGAEFEVTALGPDGRVTRVLRRLHSPVPTTEADLRALLPERFSSVLMGHLPPDHTLPAISGVLIDEVNNVWVGHHRRDPEAPAHWSVFNPDGALVATSTLPSSLRPLHIGADFLVGLWRDESEVEFVRVHRLRK